MTLNRTVLIFPITLVLYEIATYLSNDMYLPSLPNIVADLGIDQDTGQHTLLYWFLGSASMQLLLGPISDKYGRRVVLLTGGVFYILATFVCAMSDNVTAILIARFIQGCTVCSCVVAGYAAIHEQYDSALAIRIIAIMGSITILAPAFGPLLGAIILQIGDWRDIFFLLAYMSLFLVIALWRVMPGTLDTHHDMNLKSVLNDYKNIAFNWIFLRYALPFCFLFLGFICWIVESPFIIIETHGKSAMYYGIVQLLVFGFFMVGAQITNLTVHRLGAGKLITLGMIISLLAAIFLLSLNFIAPNQLNPVIGGMVLLSLGASMAFGPLNRLAIEACEEPMGCRMAIFSSYMSIFGVVATYIVTLFNDKTLDNLVYLIVFGVVCAVIIDGLGRLKYNKIL